MTATTTRVITVGSAVAAMLTLGVVAWRIICYHNDDTAQIRQSVVTSTEHAAEERAAIRDRAATETEKVANIATSNAAENKVISAKIGAVESLLLRIDTDRREQGQQIMQALQRLERSHGRGR